MAIASAGQCHNFAADREEADKAIAVQPDGHFAFTGLVLDRLLATPGSRVVTVASPAHQWGRINFDDLQSEQRYRRMAAYGQSKLANLLFTYELQRRLAAAGAQTIALAATQARAGPSSTGTCPWPRWCGAGRGESGGRSPKARSRAPCRSCGPRPTRTPAAATITAHTDGSSTKAIQSWSPPAPDPMTRTPSAGYGRSPSV
jgi:NAD(P)-dependent dehydrogenase (short-subunit alcohol dehydrogenase family)